MATTGYVYFLSNTFLFRVTVNACLSCLVIRIFTLGRVADSRIFVVLQIPGSQEDDESI